MQIDQNARDEGRSRRRRGPVPTMTVVALTLGFLAVLLLRNDWWNWSQTRPLLLGFIPVGLWWQMLVSLAASVLMWAMVRFAWPDHLEDALPPADSAAPPADKP